MSIILPLLEFLRILTPKMKKVLKLAHFLSRSSRSCWEPISMQFVYLSGVSASVNPSQILYFYWSWLMKIKWVGSLSICEDDSYFNYNCYIGKILSNIDGITLKLHFGAMSPKSWSFEGPESLIERFSREKVLVEMTLEILLIDNLSYVLKFKAGVFL